MINLDIYSPETSVKDVFYDTHNKVEATFQRAIEVTRGEEHEPGAITWTEKMSPLKCCGADHDGGVMLHGAVAWTKWPSGRHTVLRADREQEVPRHVGSYLPDSLKHGNRDAFLRLNKNTGGVLLAIGQKTDYVDGAQPLKFEDIGMKCVLGRSELNGEMPIGIMDQVERFRLDKVLMWVGAGRRVMESVIDDMDYPQTAYEQSRYFSMSRAYLRVSHAMPDNPR